MDRPCTPSNPLLRSAAGLMPLWMVLLLLLGACDTFDAGGETALSGDSVATGGAGKDRLGVETVGNVTAEGYVYADQPSAASYAPSNRATFNAAGQPVQVTRSSAGRYEVRFAGLSAQIQGSFHTQVSAATNQRRCLVSNEAKAGADVVVSVACAAVGGSVINPASDARFTLFLLDGDDDVAFFAWQQTSRGYRILRSHNAWGSSIGMAPLGVGQYKGSFRLDEGPLPDGANLHVAGEGCTLTSWNPRDDGGRRLTFEVRCFDAFGQPVHRPFHVLALSKGQNLGYAWAEQATQSSTYAPHPDHRYHPSGQLIGVKRHGVGHYAVGFEHLAGDFPDDGIVKVTRHGGNGKVDCVVGDWPGEDRGVYWAEVRCFRTPDGAPVDSRFTLVTLSH